MSGTRLFSLDYLSNSEGGHKRVFNENDKDCSNDILDSLRDRVVLDLQEDEANHDADKLVINKQKTIVAFSEYKWCISSLPLLQTSQCSEKPMFTWYQPLTGPENHTKKKQSIYQYKMEGIFFASY